VAPAAVAAGPALLLVSRAMVTYLVYWMFGGCQTQAVGHLHGFGVMIC
jgi:hypothetical protein